MAKTRREPGAGSREPGAGSREPGAGSRWATLHPQRVVLAVARTLTSTIRLLEVLDLVRSDHRTQVLFAVDPTSAFADGTAELLARVGARVVPLDSVETLGVDLVVTASENVDLSRITAPVVVLPHGVGFHKYVPDSNGTGVRLSGVVPERHLTGRDVLLVASHADQIAQVALTHPAAAARMVVAGDVCYDRLLASRRLRPVYRRCLGVRDEHTLVVVTSTWRDQSLLGRWHDLPRRLLAELPADEYRVAMILHPNVWSWHGPWQVRAWLADARDAGLALVPPTAGWQASLVAADVVGDHGSVTCYAAALGVPVTLAAYGAEAAPGTPLSLLRRLAPPLRPEAGLREQLDRAIDRHDTAAARELAAAAFQQVGSAARMVRAVLYQRMGLPEPAAAVPVRAWPAPEPETARVRAFAVYTDTATPGVITVRRIPAVADDRASMGGSVLRHLAVYDDEPDPGLVESAAVIVRSRVADPGDAGSWLTTALRQYPGATLTAAAVAEGCLVAARGHRPILLTAADPDASPGPDADPDAMLLAAVGYAGLRQQQPTGPTMLRVGRRRWAVRWAVRSAVRPAVPPN